MCVSVSLHGPLDNTALLSAPESRKCSITFYEADRVPRTALLIDPDDCKLGRRLEADRARRAISEAIEKASGMDGKFEPRAPIRTTTRSIHLDV